MTAATVTIDVEALRRAHAEAAASLPYRHVTDQFIDGAWRPSHSTATSPVIDPATGEQWGSVPVADERDVDAAVAAARSALAGWRATALALRAELLRRMADEVEARAVPLGLTNTLENGSPVAETAKAAANAASILRHFAGLASHLEHDDIRPFPDGINETVVNRDPIGVCALIAPWNFPINLVVIKLAPALLAGCTVVMKPASPTPLSTRFLVDAAAAAGIPAGVVNFVTGDGAAGDLLVRHPGVDKVAFTGSTPVGRKIAAACGELLRPVTLELGGKSSAIVLPDADLDHLRSVLVRSCLRNTGQTCYISTRILVTPENEAAVVDLVAETIAHSPLGDPLDSSTVFGPTATAAQEATVRGYIRSGLQEGARVVAGGDLPNPAGVGTFVVPTVFADVTPEMTIAREEIFGPVITIIPVRDVEHAIEVANDTPFGLGGIVFGADEERAFEVARRVDTGSVGINFFASNHSAPFGGRHDSGMGVEYGIEGLEAYLTPQSVHRRRS
ncbi:aldehyde dehydrogenase family protein [Microcella alkalica]|uniref:Acyl-CoA reductase-like NAD-dependent aldehyde dehydrogenase n=1 Tax=Microcella alkalica TaxID=355930 RepID=A0A839EHW4_9MICO|nr:acyl-CoA reductase-like NAD-dependent aldehyde dehydrogenase [Microcella alkalica]